jgi:folate-binding protein YgfZ
VRVAGPDAADYLQRMVSNDVEVLEIGDACDALLLTAKARVIAPLRVLRLGSFQQKQGLDETHISFTKGCYLGQEPIARQRYRGKVNRRLRVLDVEGEATPGTELLYEDKKVTRRFRRKFVRQRGRAKPGLSV